MIFYLLLVVGLFLNLYSNNYSDNYEKMLNKIIVKYNQLKLEINKLIIEKAIDISYKCIYVYSLCQIEYNRVHNIISPVVIPLWKSLIKYLKDKNIIINVQTQLLKIIDKNGNIENSIIISDKSIIELSKHLFNDKKHSGIVLYDTILETGIINGIFYDSVPETLDYKVSNIKFISIELEHEKNFYAINLKSNSYNYYIVGNSLNQNFFKYYLKNVLKININEDNFDYNVTIIDHNIKFFTLQPTQYIIIGENEYHIVDLHHNKLTNNKLENYDLSDSDKSDDFIKLDSHNIVCT